MMPGALPTLFSFILFGIDYIFLDAAPGVTNVSANATRLWRTTGSNLRTCGDTEKRWCADESGNSVVVVGKKGRN